jgi:hypothetical protein
MPGLSSKLDFRLRFAWTIPVLVNGQLESSWYRFTLSVDPNILKYAFLIVLHCE